MCSSDLSPPGRAELPRPTNTWASADSSKRRCAPRRPLFYGEAPGLAQPRALRLLFIRTRSNQKVAKTNGFGFLIIAREIVLRPRPGLSCLHRFRPLRRTSASVSACSNGSLRVTAPMVRRGRLPSAAALLAMACTDYRSGAAAGTAVRANGRR